MTAARVLLLLLGACTVVDPGLRVANWPELEVVEHYVPHAEMRDRCARYVLPLMDPVACAEWDLPRRRCDIWYSADFPPSRAIIEHERAHCAGYLHR